MAQWIKSVLVTREDLSSVPQHGHKKPGTVVHTCNPSIGRQRQEDLERRGSQAC